MKASTLRINGSRVIPVDTIRFIKPLTEEDRARTAANLSIDASKFKLRIEFADKSVNLAVDTLDDINRQGVGLVPIGAERYVPAINIKAAEDLTEGDIAKLKQRADYTLSRDFRSRVEMTAGTILSTVTAEEVMALRARALGQGGTITGNPAPSPEASEPAQPSARRRGPQPTAK